jgi:hypothetical protein
MTVNGVCTAESFCKQVGASEKGLKRSAPARNIFERAFKRQICIEYFDRESDYVRNLAFHHEKSQNTERPDPLRSRRALYNAIGLSMRLQIPLFTDDPVLLH